MEGGQKAMATYVMGEIHGCFREFKRMMNKIGFSDEDKMLLVGDYIDRGEFSIDMLKWLEKCPKNVYPVKGNHDVDFAEYVRIMRRVDVMEDMRTDENSNESSILLYDKVIELIDLRDRILKAQSIKEQKVAQAAKEGIYLTIDEVEDEFEYDKDNIPAELEENVEAFDKFGTISDYLVNHGGTLRELNKWAFMLSSYPYFYKFTINGREVVVVHAGFPANPTDIPLKFKDVQDFYLHARAESIRFGGIRGGIVVAGHTPTIARKMYCFTGGRVYKHESVEKDCTFYNVDCGCCYREVSPFGKMCCLRLDDEEIFYLD